MKKRIRNIKNDGYMLYIRGKAYIRQDKNDLKYYVLDQYGICPGSGIEHEGDSFETLEEAMFNCKEYAERIHFDYV